MGFAELCHPRFDALLRARGHETYESGWLRDTDDTVVGLWADLSIAYLNPAWLRFARENGARPTFAEEWPLGRSLLDALPDVVRPHYEGAYRRCLETGAPWSEDYECSSDRMFRTFHGTAYPLGSEGLLVVHSLRIARPHEGPETGPSVERFTGRHGLILQCAYCRRFAEGGDGPGWRWVPAWVEEPPPATVTHGICPPCADHYFRRVP